MEINTSKLKSMLNAVAGCKPSKLLEISNYYELRFNINGFKLSATDGANYINVINRDCKSEEEQVVIVKADQFSKLINKTSSDTVNLEIKDSCLKVSSNGTYHVEIVEDEIYPTFSMSPGIQYKVNMSELRQSLNAGSNAKSNTPNDSYLYHYLLRNGEVITTDAIKVFKGNFEIDNDMSILIPPPLAKLVMGLTNNEATIHVGESNTRVIIEAGDVTVAGILGEGVNEYPDLSDLFNSNFPYTATIDTQAMLQTLDRLTLFIGPYDKNLIDLVFTDEGIVINTVSKSLEVVPYISQVEGLTDEVYSINSKCLIDLISTIKQPEFNLSWGFGDILKVDTESAEMIIATADEE